MKPSTIKVDMEVMEDKQERMNIRQEADDRQCKLAIIQDREERQVGPTVQKKKNKTTFVDGPAQRLVNLRISIRSYEKKIESMKAELKEYKSKEKKLLKLMDQMDNL